MCVCCNESITGGFHGCMTCKADLHSVAMCDKQWMPNDGDYFCSKACVQKHNYSDEGREADKMPLRRRPDAEEVEPDAAEADQAQQRKPTKRRGVDLTAAATRPRRDTAGPATTGAMQKTVGLGAFFNPVAAPKNAAAKKATAPKGAPVGQSTLKAAVTQQRFARAPGQAEDGRDGMPRPLTLNNHLALTLALDPNPNPPPHRWPTCGSHQTF